jgi:hypothetical protein
MYPIFLTLRFSKSFLASQKSATYLSISTLFLDSFAFVKYRKNDSKKEEAPCAAVLSSLVSSCLDDFVMELD